MANIRGIKSNNEYIISATQLTAQLTAQFALSCRLMHSCSAMDRHMQHAVFHTIAFLAFSCLAFSTPATWFRIFMSRDFMSRIFSVPGALLYHGPVSVCVCHKSESVETIERIELSSLHISFRRPVVRCFIRKFGHHRK